MPGRKASGGTVCSVYRPLADRHPDEGRCNNLFVKVRTESASGGLVLPHLGSASLGMEVDHVTHVVADFVLLGFEDVLLRQLRFGRSVMPQSNIKVGVEES